MTRFLSFFLGTFVLAGCGLTLDQLGDDAGGPFDAAGIDAGDRPPTDAGPADAGDADRPSCVDGDGDGVTDCAGDCDDGDPARHPGAPPICGDGIAQDCTETAGDDPACGGLGTYVSEGGGDDSNPGTQARPLRTIGAGLANAASIASGLVLDVYIAEGDYNEDIDLVEGASLIGGHDPATWTRDPAAHPSVLRATRRVGTYAPASITRDTAIDGMALASEQSMSSATLTIERGASPTIVGCEIDAPDTAGSSHGVDVNPGGGASTGRPLILSTRVILGDAAGGLPPDSGAVGVYVRESDVELVDLEVWLASHDAPQDGILLDRTPTSALVRGATVRRPSGSGHHTAGVVIVQGGGTVTESYIDPGACTGFCTGVGVYSAQLETIVTNNLATGGAGSPDRAQGLHVAYEGNVGAIPPIRVSSNFFMGSTQRAARSSNGILLSVPAAMGTGGRLSVGRFTNNVLFSGAQAPAFAFEEQTPGQLSPELFAHNALYSLTGQSAVYLDDMYGSVGVSGLPMVSAYSANFTHSCGVDYTALPSFQIASGSPCENGGTTTDAPRVDRDGDVRDATPDVGPDEL